MRRKATFTIKDWPSLEPKMISWLRQYDKVLYLDANSPRIDPYRRYDVLIGAGAAFSLEADAADSPFAQWQAFYDHHQDWCFGYLTYELKNAIEQLHSTHPDSIGFPALGWMVPEVVIALVDDRCTIECLTGDPQEHWEAIQSASDVAVWPATSASFKPVMTRDYYLMTVAQLREHIAAGDIYEVNFCQAWQCTPIDLDAHAAFYQLDQLAQKPFAAFLRWDDAYLLCESPERFLAKRGDTLISQPIKGTQRRGNTPEEDKLLAQSLQNDPKERAENVMIVDLVRNDLARSALPGTVEVPELFGVYTFPSVHQMISTVTATLRPDCHPIAAIKHAFPMGSMTGAPKVRAMEIIDQYEKTGRGIYSGAVGYITPQGDFDLNVVIRSLAYNRARQTAAYHTGGAITWSADPVQEYEESILKGALIRQLFIPPSQ